MGPHVTYIPPAHVRARIGLSRLRVGSVRLCVGSVRLCIGSAGILDTNMLVSAMQKSHVGGYCQTRSPNPMEIAFQWKIGFSMAIT